MKESDFPQQDYIITKVPGALEDFLIEAETVPGVVTTVTQQRAGKTVQVHRINIDTLPAVGKLEMPGFISMRQYLDNLVITPSADASKIKGVTIDDTAKGDGKSLVYRIDDQGNAILQYEKPISTTSTQTITSLGAVGDGITDDTQALQTIFDNLDSNITLDGEGKTFKVTNYLNIKKDIKIKNAFFDASQANLGDSNTGILEIKKDNYLESGQAIDGAFLKNTREITLSNAPVNIAKNDWIFVSNNEDFDVAGESKKGQMFKVWSVDTNNKKIKIVGKSMYDFNDGTSAIIQKVNTIKFMFDNIEMKSNNTDLCCGIRTYGAVNSVVKDSFFHNFEFSAIETNFSANCTFDNNLFQDITDSETGYGVNIDDGSIDIRCVNNKGYNVRHLLTCGGHFVCTRLTYDNNIAETFDAGLDAHNGSNYITVTNNHITAMDRFDPDDGTSVVDCDAIIIQGSNALVANNTCFGGRNGCYLQLFGGDKSQKSTVINNNFETCETGIQAQTVYGTVLISSNVISNSWEGYSRLENEDVGFTGILIGNSTDNLAIDADGATMIVTDNMIDNYYNPIAFRTKRTNQTYKIVKISGNSAKNTIPALKKEGTETFISVEGMDTANTSKVDMFIIENNASHKGIYVGLDYSDVKADTLKVSGNTFHTYGAKGYAIDIEKSFDNNYPLRMEIVNNTCIGDGIATPAAIDLQTKLDTHTYIEDGSFIVCNNITRGYKKGIEISDTYKYYELCNNDIETYGTDAVGISLETKVDNHYPQHINISGNNITNYRAKGAAAIVGNIGIVVETNSDAVPHLKQKKGKCAIVNNNIEVFSRGIYTYDDFEHFIISNNSILTKETTGLIIELETENCIALTCSGNIVRALNDNANEAIRTQTGNGSKFELASFSGNVTKNFKYGLFAQDIDVGYERGTVFSTGQADSERVHKDGSTGANFKIDS